MICFRNQIILTPQEDPSWLKSLGFWKLQWKKTESLDVIASTLIKFIYEDIYTYKSIISFC